MTDRGATGLFELEHGAWQALSTSGDAATSFYKEVLDDEVVMLLPGDLVIEDRGEVISSMSGDPWEHYELSDERVLTLGPGAAVITYRGTARRGDVEYSALFSSTYVRRRDEWKLAFHQQTPV